MSSQSRLVVIGASTGGIDALKVIAAGLPSSFPAPICVVLHIAPESPGVLPEILSRAGKLRATHARNGERLCPGHIYVAPPDFHLVVEPGILRVTKGPRENRFRPAIDPLFRSAAAVYGPAAMGVILSGNLDDGTAGLWMIKQLGGVAIVQDPADALCPSMPAHAARQVAVDYSVPVARIPSVLVKLTSTAVKDIGKIAVPAHMDVELKIAKEENARDAGLERVAKPSPYACPECHGVLLELQEGSGIRFRCHIGHAYSIHSLMADIEQSIETTMGTAVRALEEGALLMEQIARHFEDAHDDGDFHRFINAAEQSREQSDAIREMLRDRDRVSKQQPATPFVQRDSSMADAQPTNG